MTPTHPIPTQQETLEPCPLEGHVPQGSAATFGPGPYVSESEDPNATKYYAVVCPGCCSTAHSRSREGVIKRWNTRAAVAGDGISWTALLNVLERLRSKNRNPENEWYHGWNAAIQCLINDINSRAATSSPTPAESLLRDPVKVRVLPTPIVTRDGVPCEDQAAALEEFKERCRATVDTITGRDDGM